MQITLDLDDSLFNEALQLTNLTTQEDMIHLAVLELIRSRKKKNLLDLAGQIQFAPDFDNKSMRETHAAGFWVEHFDQQRSDVSAIRLFSLKTARSQCF